MPCPISPERFCIRLRSALCSSGTNQSSCKDERLAHRRRSYKHRHLLFACPGGSVSPGRNSGRASHRWSGNPSNSKAKEISACRRKTGYRFRKEANRSITCSEPGKAPSGEQRVVAADRDTSCSPSSLGKAGGSAVIPKCISIEQALSTSPAYLRYTEGSTRLLCFGCSADRDSSKDRFACFPGSIAVTFSEATRPLGIGSGEGYQPIYLLRSSCSGSPSTITSFDSSSEPNSCPRVRCSDGSWVRDTDLRNKRCDRQGQAPGGTRQPEGDFLPIHPCFNGQKNESHRSNRRDTGAADGEGNMRDQVPGALRRLRSPPRPRLPTTSDHDHHRFLADRQLGRSSRCHIPPGPHCRSSGSGVDSTLQIFWLCRKHHRARFSFTRPAVCCPKPGHSALLPTRSG